MNIREIAKEYRSLRHFFTLEEYFNKNSITDITIQNAIKLEVLEIEEEEKRMNQLIDKLLQCTRAFKFSQSDNRKNFFIYSPCAKKKGFQLTFFYKSEPISDIFKDSITEIKDEIMQYINKYDYLEEIIGKLE